MKEIELIRKCRRMLPRLGKRPRTVLARILAKGAVSTYELGQLGYDQPPRAAQDLKEAGVRLKTSFGKHPKSGARMAIYSLAGLEESAALSGRSALPKSFRNEVLRQFDDRCNVCATVYPHAVLQLDHRVPYIVGGEGRERRVTDFQPLCGSHQRSKSWECEHCPNRTARDVRVCQTCYWAIPDGDYDHVATKQERRMDITWTGNAGLVQYERIKRLAAERGESLSAFVKTLIASSLSA